MEHELASAAAEPGIERSSVAVRGLAVITVFVSDIDRATRFYKDVLGFEEGEQMLEPGITLQAGDLTIYLHGGREATERNFLLYPEISLAMVVASVRASARKLRDNGVVIVSDYEEASEYFASIQFADPDGNLLQLWGRP
jgi:catechol 2,3-dioxygenase-like lactoylglutathione lyase family enzyme